MSSQIQITGETKVKSLTGVLTGTSGVVGFLPIDVSLGIPQLDVNGKILVSQLPNSVMEYKGTWDASTNTPTLANGTGNQGDVYLCSVAGTVNFGAGAIAFFVGDQVIYSGSIWQRASGATGTVTSVAVTETGDSLNITGSPITTSGTINIGFNGTNLQYVNGAGNLTTFPILTGYVTAVSGTAPVVSSGGTTPAISMAAATGSVDGYLSATDFAIFNAKQSALTFSSPLVNTSGTISIPAATTSVNGYLASADFTTFNNKQNAITLTTTGTSGVATLVGATLNIPNYGSALTGYVPYTGATQDVDLGAFSLNGKSLHIKGTAGNGHLGLKHQSAAATGSANESLIYADSLGDLSWQNANLYLSKFITSANTANRSYTFPNATCNIPDDSLVVHLAGTETITGAKTFTATSLTLAPTSGGGTLNLKQDAFLGATNGYTSLTSSGSDFAIIAATGVSTSKQAVFSLASLGSTLRTYTLPDATGTIALVGGSGVGTVTSVAALTIGTTGTDLSSSVANSTTTPVITLNVPTASAVNRGALSSADWTTFNGKQGTITLTTTGTSGVATFSANTLNIPDYGSALSGYLPLTGGTLSGALGGTSATFSSNITFSNTNTGINYGSSRFFLYNGNTYVGDIDGLSSGSLILRTNGTDKLIITSGGAATFSSSVTATGQIIANAGSGAISVSGTGYTINPTNMLIGRYTSTRGYIQVPTNGTFEIWNGGTFEIATFNETGKTTTLYGALTGTSATFSSSVTATSGIFNSTTQGISVSLGGYIYTVGRIGGSNSGNILSNNGTGTNLIIAETATNVFGIGGGTLGGAYNNIGISLNTSTGAATFSSSIQSTSSLTTTNLGFTNTNASQAGFIANYTGTGALQVSFSTYNDTMNIYNETNAYAIVTFKPSSKAFIINPTNGGNVLIGTTTDAGYKLDVNGTLRVATSFYTTGGTRSIEMRSYAADWNYMYSNGAPLVFGTQDANTLYIRTNSVDRLTIASTGAATFSSTIAAGNSTFANGSGLSQTTIGQTSTGYAGLRLAVDATFYSWIIGAQYNVSNAFEITPSTAVGGSTFTTPVFKILNTGAATFSDLAGTGTRVVEASSAGLLSATKILDEGTYTPTKSGGSGSWTSFTMGLANWTRVGNRVTVWGNIDATSVSGVSTQDFYITIPITSTNSTGGLLIGNDGVIGGIINNGNMQGFQWSTTQFYIVLQSDGTYSHQFTYTYTYLI